MRVEILAFDGLGKLLHHTWHTSPGSVHVELAAYKARMARGEIGRVEIVDMEDATVERVVVWAGTVEKDPV